MCYFHMLSDDVRKMITTECTEIDSFLLHFAMTKNVPILIVLDAIKMKPLLFHVIVDFCAYMCTKAKTILFWRPFKKKSFEKPLLVIDMN